MSSFGEWDECMELDSPQSSSTGLIVKGQYCVMELKVPVPMVNEMMAAAAAGADVERHPVFQFIQKHLSVFKLSRMNSPTKMVELLNILNGTIFRTGLCIPHLCKAQEIENVITNCEYSCTS